MSLIIGVNMDDQNIPQPENLSDEAKEKLEEMKNILENFKDKLLEKFENYLTGVALLPPPKDENQQVDKSKINVLVTIDDSDSINSNKQELKEKAEKAINKRAQSINKTLAPQVMLHSEIWQSCFDSKYEILQLVAMSAPVYDAGILSALKIGEVHKNMILKKFEKYIVSYILVGSLPRGEATSTSDIDAWIIIDDTDVKKMTRAELKDKLRSIILSMAFEAGEVTGIQNKLNCQVHILTDVWDSIKEANPVIFTFLRDGIPFYDKGIFMPWKQLLKMGKIKPSQEAIDMFMSSGDQILKRVEYKIKEIGMEDIYSSILGPSQAALMLYGIPPPSPKETAKLMDEVFVRKEKLLEEKYTKILSETIQVRKDLEHGTMDKISGKKIDSLISNAEKYLKRVNKLFKQIEQETQKERFSQTYDDVITVVRDALKTVGVKYKEKTLVEDFKKSLVNSGEIPQKYLTILEEIVNAKKDFDSKKLLKSDIEKLNKKCSDLIRHLVEYMQRKRSIEYSKAKLSFKHGDKYGELIMLEEGIYLIPDTQDNVVYSAEESSKGGLKNVKETDMKKMEEDMANKRPKSITIKQQLLEDLKKHVGKDVEVLFS